MINFNFKRSNYKRYYIKFYPFHIDERSLRKAQLTGQMLGIILLTFLISYTLIQNLAPFGATLNYSTADNDDKISDIEPSDRVKIKTINKSDIVEVLDDHIYFTTKMPYAFDKATIRVTYKNFSPEQNVLIGFQDQEDWHYDTTAIDVPYLNGLDWKYIGNDRRLYQKEMRYKTVNQFLGNFPKDSIVGYYGIDSDFWNVAYKDSRKYSSSDKETIIDVPLRGPHTIYAYLQNEPFIMNIIKQDLNWYKDPDVMTVKIYKDDQLVYEVFTDDDGIQDDSKKTLPPQDVSIQNTGSGYPEPGIYKIVIDANSDTIIKRISTNLHKLVFDSTIFPVANSISYPNIIDRTKPTVVYTDALTLSAMTYRESGKQTVQVGSRTLTVNETAIDRIIIPNQNLAQVIIPSNDILLRGFLGYFAFDRDQYFRPTKNYILSINQKQDLDLVDYVFTTYEPSKVKEGWQFAERTVDLRAAYIKDNELSWMIQSPGLKEYKRRLIIQSIDITFEKESWFN